MARVLCDTSFLIALATKEIKNLSRMDIDIGTVDFVVPSVVREELCSLARLNKKSTPTPTATKKKEIQKIH